MKKWKQWILMAILTFFGLIIIFTACDEDNGNNDQTDPNYIGKYADIEVWIADGVDRQHGEIAFASLQMISENDIRECQNQIDESRVVRKVIITGPALESAFRESFDAGVLRGSISTYSDDAGNGGIFYLMGIVWYG